MRGPVRASSAWTVLPLLAVIALAGCVPPPVPHEAPAPPPPAAPPAPEAAPVPAPGKPSAISDQDFINRATGLGNTEIGMGRLAEGKGSTRPIRAFASQMVTGHSHANQELALLAKRVNLVVAPPPDQPPPVLLTAAGPEFDKAYIALVISGHQNLIALFESEANNGQDPRLKHYARSLLPELHHHLHEAQVLGGRVGAVAPGDG